MATGEEHTSAVPTVVLVQVYAPGDNSVVNVGGFSVEAAESPRQPSRQKRGWANAWMWLLRLVDRAAGAGHFIAAGVVVLVSLLGAA